ncbi:MAG: 4Fe-4S dicluster domain-containing protein [Planctomycetes bacterium]|nr:4Fe-4S dicluster domain-containing protein [Planctomycetota bacterium]
MPKITVEHVRSAGVVGAGGAGFPTHVKLSAKADTAIINAAECEPLLHKDKEVLRNFADEVIEGLAAAMQLTGAKRGVIGVKEKYSDVIDSLRRKLASDMEILPLKDAYPAGDEFVLVYDVLGRVIPPGGIPLDVGAVVMNVETALNVSRSHKTPVVEKFVSVAGAVMNPVTLRVPVGTPLSACVAAAGLSASDPVYIVGGVMMGRLTENPDEPVAKTTGAVIVLPADHIVVRRYRRDWKSQVRIGRSACDQCSFCTELCPRYLLGHPIEPHRAMRSLAFNLIGEANVRGTAFCCECNLCSMYSCPEDLDPKAVCGQNKRRLATEGEKWADSPFNADRPGLLMAGRKAPTKRLYAKLGLGGFQNVGPLVEKPLKARKVGIALKQHVGAACLPLVKPGQKVSAGQQIGQVPEKDGKPSLGAPVHASIAGTVCDVRDGIVWIEG